MTRYLSAALAGAMLLMIGLGGCSSDESTPNGPKVSQPSKPDPYQVYLEHAPKGQKILSRQDAATRAQLGCGQKWPPGTVDAVLAEAYADYC